MGTASRSERLLHLTLRKSYQIMSGPAVHRSRSRDAARVRGAGLYFQGVQPGRAVFAGLGKRDALHIDGHVERRGQDRDRWQIERPAQQQEIRAAGDRTPAERYREPSPFTVLDNSRQA